MSISRRLQLLLLTACASAASFQPALAQDIDDPETVRNRPRPEFDAAGLPFGGLRLYPALGVEFQHRDNVFATADNERSDTAVLFRPEVSLRSDWSRHALEIGASLDAARYGDLDTEDYDDVAIWARSRLDVRNGRFIAQIRYDDVHEPRTSPNARQGVELTDFSTTTLELGYRYQAGRFFVAPGIRQRDLDYDPTRTADGIIDNGDRDRDNSVLNLRVGYDYSPDLSLFGDLQSTDVDYDRDFDLGGFNRDADGRQLVFGALMNFSDRIFGEAFVGYLDWEYDDLRFAGTDGLTFGVDVTWNLTPLMTLSADGNRRVRATTVDGSASIDQTRLGLRLDYELLRNLILTASVASIEDDFEDIDRSDDVFVGGIGGRYLMNRRLSLDFGFDHHSRDSSGGGNEFDIDVLYVRINGQL